MKWNKLLTFCLTFMFLLVPFSHGVDLILDGTSTTLSGSYAYDNVQVINGGILYVTNTLELNVSTITVDSSSTIEGSGRGQATTGDGGDGGGALCANPSSSDRGARVSGGGGAGYGATGGSGGSVPCDTQPSNVMSGGSGGTSYQNNTNFNLIAGSTGGRGGGYDATGGGGGSGGAGILINATDSITINGIIDMDGNSGGGPSNFAYQKSKAGGGGGGGGSGGTIILYGNVIDVSNGELDVSGGLGGSGNTANNAYNRDAGGGGGAGGRIKVFYGFGYTNTSATIDYVGGSGGSCDRCGSGGGTGSTGTYYIEQVSGSFNNLPTLDTNATIPSSPNFGDTVYINITTSDLENDSINGVSFGVRSPNGTSILATPNGNYISGNASQGSAEQWHSSTFLIESITDSVGTWTWNVSIASDDNQNVTYSDTFTLTDGNSPVLDLTSLASSQVWNRNVSLPIDYTVSDDVELDTCWYNINGGANVTLTDCQNSTFNRTAGTFSFNMYANDTSGNIDSISLTGITVSEDTITPTISVILPTSNSSSKNILGTVQSTDLGGVEACTYNVTRGASLEIGNTAMSFNVSGDDYWTGQFSVSSDFTNYTYNVECIDYAGYSNSTTQAFYVDTGGASGSPGGGGGGGGGGTTITNIFGISGLENQFFRISPASDEVRVSVNTVRNFDFEVENIWVEPINITATIVGDNQFVNMVTFDGDFNSIYFILEKESGFETGTRFIEYEIDSNGVDLGIYNGSIVVESNGETLEFIVEISVTDSFFDKVLFNVGDFEVTVLLFGILLVIFIAVLFFIWNL